MDPAERREGLRSVDWLPYIQPARDSEEQNMEAYVKEGQVYFRALRIIKAGEEMLVWYSKDFAQLLNIPELPRVHAEGEQKECVSERGEGEREREKGKKKVIKKEGGERGRRERGGGGRREKERETHTDTQADTQTHRQTRRQADRHTPRQTHRQTEIENNMRKR